MRWLIDNWSLLVVVFAVVVLGVVYFRHIASLSNNEKIAKVKEWLLYAVIMAEKELGTGTGQLKLRYVYNMFVEKFPDIDVIVTFEMFSRWVDEALEKMRPLLESNLDLKGYVGLVDGKEDK